MPACRRKARFPEDITTKHTKHTKDSGLLRPAYFVCFVHFVVNLRLDRVSESSQQNPCNPGHPELFSAIPA